MMAMQVFRPIVPKIRISAIANVRNIHHGNMPRNSIGNTLRNSIGNTLRKSIGNTLRNSIAKTLRNSIANMPRNSLGDWFGNLFGSTVRPQVFLSSKARGFSEYGDMFNKRLYAEKIGRKFEVSDDELKDIQHRMTAAVAKGMNKTTRSTATVKCWDVHVDQPVADTASVPAACASVMPKPRVSEFLSLDVPHCGTRINTRFTTISPRDNQVVVKSAEREIPCLKTGGRELFNRAAEHLAEFAAQNNVNTTDMPLAFTFGFPARHTSLEQAALHRWTKEFQCGGELLCTNIVHELRKSLAQVNVQVGRVALFNDLTVVLLNAQVDHPNARISLAVDEGCNCCFVERVANVRDRQIVGKDAAAVSTVVNSEWGAFGERGELDHLKTSLDRKLDEMSLEPGKQIFEKMTSGMYMGELVRQFIVMMAENSILFQGQVSKTMNTAYALNIEHLIRVESDAQGSYEHSRRVLSDVLGICHPTEMDCALFRYASECVTKRSAHLVAASVASIVHRLQSGDPRNATDIVVKGSVFSKYPRYEDTMTQKLKCLIPYTGSILPQSCSYRGVLKIAQLLAQLQKQ